MEMTKMDRVDGKEMAMNQIERRTIDVDSVQSYMHNSLEIGIKQFH